MVEQDRNLSVIKGMKQLDSCLMDPVESMFSFSKRNHSPILQETTSVPHSLSLNKPFGDTIHSVESSAMDSFFSNLTQQENLKPMQLNKFMSSNKRHPSSLDCTSGETWLKPVTDEEPLEDFLHRLISKNDTHHKNESFLSSPVPSFQMKTSPCYLTSSGDIQSTSNDILKEKRNAEATFALKNILRIPPRNSSFLDSNNTLHCHDNMIEKKSDPIISSSYTMIPDHHYFEKKNYCHPRQESSLCCEFPDFQYTKSIEPIKGSFSCHSSLDKTTLESFLNESPFELQNTSILNKKNTSLQNVNMNIQGASIPLFSYPTCYTKEKHIKNSNILKNKYFDDSNYSSHLTDIPYIKKETCYFPSPFLQNDSYYNSFNGSSSSRINSTFSIPHTRRKFSKSLSTDISHTTLYNLSLCFPITLPYGKIHVTKASGENFYSFTDPDLCPDETIRENASLLFSPVAGLCDAWATFLHIQAGFIQNVKADDIQRVVHLFHIVMNSNPTPTDLFETPLKFICKGVQPYKSQNYSKFKSSVSDNKLQTYAFLQDSKAFQQFLFLKQKLNLLKDAINAVYNPNANLTLFNTTLFNAITTFKQATISSSNDPLTFTTLFDPFNTPDEQLVKDTIQLPILIREYGQVENRELEERFMKDKTFVETHQVPNVEVSELRIEHQSKKMVDPRFRDNFVLTRQMAGDENPRQWTTQKEHTTSFHTKSTISHTKNKMNSHQENNYKKVDSPLSNINTSIPGPHDTFYSLQNINNSQNKSSHTNCESCPVRSLQSSDIKHTTDNIPSTSNNSIGRYQFCFNADVPLIEIAYRDAKDCLSSTHGFIYMRHLMAQKQPH